MSSRNAGQAGAKALLRAKSGIPVPVPSEYLNTNISSIDYLGTISYGYNGSCVSGGSGRHLIRDLLRDRLVILPRGRSTGDHVGAEARIPCASEIDRRLRSACRSDNEDFVVEERRVKENKMPNIESLIRVRMSTADGHYGGGLVDGAHILALFGDAVTELLIRNDGDEGLMRAMQSEYLAPVRSGDYIEVRAKLLSIGATSRKFECTAHKVIESVDSEDSAANVLAQPLLVVKATGVAVVPREKQRFRACQSRDRKS